jgi:hypothetical protein
MLLVCTVYSISCIPESARNKTHVQYIYTFLLRMTSRSNDLSSWDILYIYSSVALKPFVGTWHLCQFCKLIQSQWDSLNDGPVRRNAGTYAQDGLNTN